MNSAATSFRAESRLGFKSLASMLEETSIAITISMPLVVLVRVDTSWVCGRAMATITAARARSLIAGSTGYNRASREGFPKPLRLGIRRLAESFLRLNQYQSTAAGSNKSSQKNSGFAKSIWLPIIRWF